MKALIRRLLLLYPTAAAIRAYFSTAIDVVREEPVTYRDLTKRFTAAQVKSLDTALAASGLDWMRNALAAGGIDFSDIETRNTLDVAVAAGTLPAGMATTLKRIGIAPSTVWQVEGFQSLPSEGEIQAVIDSLAPDGEARSLVVRVRGDKFSVAFSRQATSGEEPVSVLESFSSSKEDDARLTASQRVFRDAILALILGY